MQAGDVLAAVAGAVRVDASADLVHQLGLGNLNPAFQQVDDLLFAGVLELFQARDGDRSRVLLQVVLSRRDGAVRSDVDHVVAGVGTGVLRVRVVVHQLLKDHVAARNGLDVAALAQLVQEGVVVGDAIRQHARAALDRGGDDIAQVSEGRHVDVLIKKLRRKPRPVVPGATP
ncbi:hypothetical protein D3C86_850180 [compost metagenome]